MDTREGENKWSLISEPCGGTPRFMRGYEMGKADGSALMRAWMRPRAHLRINQ